MSCLVLVVEDEALIALDIEDILSSHGYQVTAVARDRKQAELHLGTRTDLVILDADLNGDSTAPLAEQLRTSSIPFVVVTGFSCEQLEWVREAPLVRKPFSKEQLISAVRQVRS